MAFPAKDGTKFTNKSSQQSHDAMNSAPPADPGADQGPPPIESDPEAMQCVQLLAQKGYTGEEVAQAVDQLTGQSSEQGDMNAPAA
jgi:hypothetical protein